MLSWLIVGNGFLQAPTAERRRLSPSQERLRALPPK
jgi:hypothetical protein